MNMPQHVLLIEDNEIAQRIPTIILQEAGCEVDVAANGLQALKFAKNNTSPYDLILLDIGLPDLDGFEVAKQLRQSADITQAPIIGLTAHLDTDTQCEHITETVSKPFTADLLKHILKKYF